MHRYSLLFLLVFLTACCSNHSARDQHDAQARALQIAQQTFAELNRGPLSDYDVSIQDGNGEWQVLFQPKGENAKPGAHTLVLVDKKSERARVVQGR
jgi:hypothetical protein